MTEVFLGQITTFGFQFAPKYFAFCNGQLLPIAQNQALFSLLGTQYGGNGTTNFALPDLRSRTPVGAGSSVDPGWNPAPYNQGETGGVENVTLLSTQMPNHNHIFGGNSTAADNRNPTGMYFGTTTKEMYSTTGGAQVPLSPATIGMSGNTQPHANVQPYLAINFCIALSGVYPSRN
jgi:microcystin-dependent protein